MPTARSRLSVPVTPHARLSCRAMAARSAPSRGRPSGTECLAVYEQGHPVTVGHIRRDKTVHIHRPCGKSDLHCSAVRRRVVCSGSDDHTLRCWDLNTPAPVAVIPFYSRRITSCSAAADGSILAAGFHDGSGSHVSHARGRAHPGIQRAQKNGYLLHARSRRHPARHGQLGRDNETLAGPGWGDRAYDRCPCRRYCRTCRPCRHPCRYSDGRRHCPGH